MGRCEREDLRRTMRGRKLHTSPNWSLMPCTTDKPNILCFHFHSLLLILAVVLIYRIPFSSSLETNLNSSAMGNCLPLPSNAYTEEAKSKKPKPLPIETTFTFPASLPSWATGEGFASGTVELGGLQARQISTFTKVWAALEGGPDNSGATFFEPAMVPRGFSILGSYAQPNNRALFGQILVVKDTSGRNQTLKPPLDYTLVWSSASSEMKQEGQGYFWLPIAPNGYKAIGVLVTSSPQKPGPDAVQCVRSDLTDPVEPDDLIWRGLDKNGFNVLSLRPSNRGVKALGVIGGTFVGQIGTPPLTLACLRNNNVDNKTASPWRRDRPASTFSPMPDPTQINLLFDAYAPLLNFHKDEAFFPSSVTWFFENGALLYTKGKESTPVKIEPTGANLPQFGATDGLYWLDLPQNNPTRDFVKKGSLQSSEAYLHIKPMFGSTYTDIAIWIFYPFNGGARAKLGFIQYFSLGKIGQHVGDWEHVTLRISNFNGELCSVYFSQHSKGRWVPAPELLFKIGSNKPLIYPSYNGHATYPGPGLVLQGNEIIGIRNDAGTGGKSMDTGAKYVVVAADYLDTADGATPPQLPWLEFSRKWGPNITHQDVENELRELKKMLPGKKLKSDFQKFVESLPPEVLGEDGPTGPKYKNNWDGDEVE